jgi:hypothetical protein
MGKGEISMNCGKCLCPNDCREECQAVKTPVPTQSLMYRLRKRAEIRRQIPGRLAVVEGKPDKIADLLDEAANEIESLRKQIMALSVTLDVERNMK